MATHVESGLLIKRGCVADGVACRVDDQKAAIKCDWSGAESIIVTYTDMPGFDGVPPE